MSTLAEVLMSCVDFTPKRPTDARDQLKCLECGYIAPLTSWIAHDGWRSGYWCETCYDFHSCIECPNCEDLRGAAGACAPVGVIPFAVD